MSRRTNAAIALEVEADGHFIGTIFWDSHGIEVENTEGLSYEGMDSIDEAIDCLLDDAR